MGCLLFLFALESDGASVLSLFQNSFVSFKNRHQSLGFLIARSRYFLLFCKLSIYGFQVFKLEFGINDTLIFDGIYGCTAFTNYIIIIKAADDMDNGIALTNVSEKFISQSFAFTGTLYEACNIYYFTSGRNDSARMNDFSKFI